MGSCYDDPMSSKNDDWVNSTKLGCSLLFVFFTLIVLLFATPCYLLLRLFTNWSAWILVIIAIPVGTLLFLAWAKANQLNGYDGISLDEGGNSRKSIEPSSDVRAD